MRSLIVLLGLVILPRTAWAQAPVAVPNPMATHTLFIVIIVAAFLAWAVSFSVTTRRDQLQKTNTEALKAQRETILDELTETEAARKAGALNEKQFNRKTRHLRAQLAGVLARLEHRAGKQQNAR